MRKRTVIIISIILVLAGAVAYSIFGQLRVKQVTVTFAELRAEDMPRLIPGNTTASQNLEDYAYALLAIELKNPQLYRQHVGGRQRADHDLVSDEALWERDGIRWTHFGYMDYRTIPVWKTGGESLGQVLIYRDGRTDEQVLDLLRGQAVTISVDKLLPGFTIHYTQQISLGNALPV